MRSEEWWWRPTTYIGPQNLYKRKAFTCQFIMCVFTNVVFIFLAVLGPIVISTNVEKSLCYSLPFLVRFAV